MFDKKTTDAYKKITPSEVCRERILNMEAEQKRRARQQFPRRTLASAAAAFLVFVCVIAAVITSSSDGLTVSVGNSGGELFSAGMREVTPQSAEYQSEPVIRIFDGNTDTPAKTLTLKAENCFYFELYSKKTATAAVDAGFILQYDTDKGAFVNAGASAVFKGECRVYWCLPEAEAVKTRSMTLTAGRERSEITLSYDSESGAYTVLYEKTKGNDKS